LAGWSLLGYSVVTVAATLMRKYLHIAIPGIDEYGGYVFAIVSAIGFSYAFLERSHIRVEVLREKMSPRTQAVFDMLALVSIVFTSGFLAYFAFDVLAHSIALDARANTPLRTPMVFPQALWAGALALFALICVFYLLRCSAAILKGDMNFVRRLMGGVTISEEIHRDMQGVLPPTDDDHEKGRV